MRDQDEGSATSSGDTILGPLGTPKPYVSVRELSQLTPWTEQAVRTMIAKGTFRSGWHYFHVGRRPVFRWDRVVDFIEGRDVDATDAIPMRRGGFLGAPPK